MRARAVIGANFGDEGKGLVTDYLCSQGAGMVVRFNGGAQAGHTVVTPGGDRHVFSHVGTGTFHGVPTYLSQFFVCNPLLYLRERDRLRALRITPVVYAHPNCLVTTFADMWINQQLEDKRGSDRHGSCGVGVNETVERSQVPDLKITMSDLWNGASLVPRLERICGKYAAYRTGRAISAPGGMIEAFVRACGLFAEAIAPLGIAQCRDPVFEGAQGLLLSQDNKTYFPHVTRSYTGLRNVHELCEQAGISDIETYFVSRTYLTRHGAGPLPGEQAGLRYADDTNLPHDYQGRLRFAPLDVDSLFKRCAAEAGGQNIKLVLTHCDQRAPTCAADLYVDGPTRNHVEVRPFKKARANA